MANSRNQPSWEGVSRRGFFGLLWWATVVLVSSTSSTAQVVINWGGILEVKSNIQDKLKSYQWYADFETKIGGNIPAKIQNKMRRAVAKFLFVNGKASEFASYSDTESDIRKLFEKLQDTEIDTFLQKATADDVFEGKLTNELWSFKNITWNEYVLAIGLLLTGYLWYKFGKRKVGPLEAEKRRLETELERAISVVSNISWMPKTTNWQAQDEQQGAQDSGESLEEKIQFLIATLEEAKKQASNDPEVATLKATIAGLESKLTKALPLAEKTRLDREIQRLNTELTIAKTKVENQRTELEETKTKLEQFIAEIGAANAINEWIAGVTALAPQFLAMVEALSKGWKINLWNAIVHSKADIDALITEISELFVQLAPLGQDQTWSMFYVKVHTLFEQWQTMYADWKIREAFISCMLVKGMLLQLKEIQDAFSGATNWDQASNTWQQGEPTTWEEFLNSPSRQDANEFFYDGEFFDFFWVFEFLKDPSFKIEQYTYGFLCKKQKELQKKYRKLLISWWHEDHWWTKEKSAVLNTFYELFEEDKIKNKDIFNRYVKLYKLYMTRQTS